MRATAKADNVEAIVDFEIGQEGMEEDLPGPAREAMEKIVCDELEKVLEVFCLLLDASSPVAYTFLHSVRSVLVEIGEALARKGTPEFQELAPKLALHREELDAKRTKLIQLIFQAR